MQLTKQTLLDYLQKFPNRPQNISQLMHNLEIQSHRRPQVRTLLKELIMSGDIEQLRNKHYRLKKKEETTTGILELHPRGFGFVRQLGTALGSHDLPDIFIPPPFIGEAITSDKVEVRITKEGGKGPEGRIVRVLERGRRFVVGQITQGDKYARVIPRDKTFLRQIQIRTDKKTRLLNNDTWVMVEIQQWTPLPEPLLAKISEVLGEGDEPRMGITILMKDLGISEEFSQQVIDESEAIQLEISADELAHRTDFRSIPVITIDPQDAKDFDDALSIKSLPNGNFELGVHIADVSHYVRAGTVLDAEALRRATSIYPIDRVVPMLPEHLSNNICSLRPDEDRLVMSVLMEIDPKGTLVGSTFHEGIIRSCRRFTYEEVQAIFDKADRFTIERCSPQVHDALHKIQHITKILMARRSKRGSLDLDIPEAKVEFDSQGNVRTISFKPRLYSHRLVEECMLMANETVASYLTEKTIPLLYRIHEEPNLDKLIKISHIFKQMGMTFDPERAMQQKYLQKIIGQLNQFEAGHILHTFILRAMMRAKYSVENKGHYGLASPCYCHFTSPIRRYPDLIVHRQLRSLLEKNRQPESKTSINIQGSKAPRHHKEPHQKGAGPIPKQVIDREEQVKTFVQMADHCSNQEQKAQEIEYEAFRIKAHEFMQNFIGEEFDGYICGITNWGMYVELKQYPVDGIIPLKEMEDDYYDFDDVNYILRGRKSKRTFRLAQPVRVWLHSLDPANQKLSLRLC